MIHTIQSDLLKAQFSSVGAEPVSLIFNNTELLWQGKENFWPGKAPLLFPICGFLKEDRYLHGGNEYKMNAHGFAKDQKFKVKSKQNNSLCFVLTENAETLKQYPFPFSFKVTYTLKANSLKIDFDVENTGLNPLPFSLGWHPGFNCNFPAELRLEGKYMKHDLADGGLIDSSEPQLFSNDIHLDKNTFKDGGIVLTKEGSTANLNTGQIKLSMHYENFPAMVLWGQPGEGFICIEPWHGMGDAVDHNFNLAEKENILLLDPGKNFQRSIELFIDFV